MLMFSPCNLDRWTEEDGGREWQIVRRGYNLLGYETNVMIWILWIQGLSHLDQFRSFWKVYQTEGCNSLPNSPENSTDSSASSLLWQLHITCRVIARQSESIRSWNSTFTSLLMNDKMIGMTCCHWPSFNTITMYTQLHNKPPLCWIQGDTLGWALSHTRQINEWRQSMSSRIEWRRPSRRLNQH